MLDLALRRYVDWPTRLTKFVLARMNMPNTPGVNDCITFGADSVVEITGHDLLGPLRGSWSTEDEANALLAGYGGLQAAVSSVLGPPHVPIRKAERGDLVHLVIRGVDTLAVCDGPICWAPAKDGLMHAPTVRYARAAWGIGR